jgi:hypothetical protein
MNKNSKWHKRYLIQKKYKEVKFILQLILAFQINYTTEELKME